MGLILVVLLLALVFGGLRFVYPCCGSLRCSSLSSGSSASPSARAKRRHGLDTGGRGFKNEETAWQIVALTGQTKEMP